ncbi:carbohydrate binding domain-containing protein [Winogradskyella sp. MIT101101]|uniref:carbohydrate binding domain-containing protein n=1 Tax=Winogradskyella sp. MIT101101 TaxID=3098297 RepID=UPI00399A928B
MKKKYSLIFLAFLCFVVSGYGQVANGDFESWTGSTPDSWTTIDGGITTAEETTIVHGGSSSANINVTTGTQASTDFRQTVALVNGDNYTASVWVRHTEGGMRARLYIDGYQGYSTPANTTTWQELTYTFTATSTSIEIGLRFYDVAGFDGAEIVYVDDFTLTNNSGTPSCSITDISLSNSSSCNDNGTASDASDDYYTSDVTVTYSNAPASGTIDLTGAGVVGGTTSVAVGTSPQTITGVQLAANGADVEIIATFSAETTCNYTETVAGSGVASCSGTPSGDCASETFDNIPTASSTSYQTRNWTGDDGIDWTATDSRADQNINGNAILIRDGTLLSNTFPGGIGNLTVTTQRIFSGGTGNMNLLVNGVVVGTIPYDGTVQTTTIANINVDGDITVEIDATNSSSDRVGIDDLSWTCYSACTPPTDPTGTISGATPVCAASTSLSFSGSAPTDVVYYWQNSSLGEDQTNDAASNLTVTTSGDYYVRAYNTVESCWSDGEVGPYSVSVTTSAPIINSQPSDLTAAVGGSVSYTVVSPNTASYQWQVSTNGGSTWSNVGTDSSSLTITNVQLTDDGNLYQVILTNACGSTTSNTATLTVTTSTLFNPGELIFVGFDGQINGSGSNDEFLIATLVDITNGTEFSIVNSRYEAGAAANVRTEKWGGGSDDPSEAPFETKITYTGSSVIPAGSVLRFEITTSNTFVVFATVTEGTTTTTSTSDFTVNVVNAGSYANISTSGDDQLYLMQGDFVSDGNIDANEANYLFTGTLLHGITIGTSWVPLTSACSGNTSTRESRLPPELRCFNVESISSIRGYYENDKEHGLATIRVIVNNVSDNSSNWDLTSYNFDPTDDTASSGGKTFLINPSNPAGQWVGDVDTNWFNCANWEGLAVPKSTTNVEIDNTAMNIAQIDYTASFSDDFSDIATCNNLIISGSSVDLSGNNANILEVNGNLIIDGMGTGSLNMDDGNNATADGLLYLSGNWTNELTDAAFLEGNGTVIFRGANPQTITYGGPPIPPGPFESEIFYNVVLDNDFDIATTDRTFIMSGNLTVNPGRTLNVQSGQLIEVGNMVTNLGSFTLQDSASLIQVNDVTNVGNLTMNRDYIVDSSYDYVYWSSPITDFNTDDLPINNGHIYKWNPTATNTGSGQGNWESAASEIMQEGIGYIARVPSTVPATLVFQNGVPNNGDVNLNLSRGLNPASEDDDWNLVGNPYPSSISALAFLNANTNLEGFVNLWTHGADPSLLEPDPFYEDYVYNYNEDDYITYNGTATTNGPSGFSGYIAAGQSFMVNTVNGLPSTTIAMSFENSMRQRDYDNSNFYRLNPQLTSKHRIWLDFGMSDEPVGKRIVIGYVPNATMEEDRLYDAKWIGDETEQRFYSILNESDYLIQGRALPFSDEDVVPVGFNAIIAGNYTIAISAVDGVFDEGNQDIFIKDNLLGLVHNLSSNPYSFNSEVGEFNDRFEIVFRADALSIDDNQLDDNDLSIVEQSNGDVRFSIGKNLTITTVEILDVLGRQVYNLKGNSSVEVYDLSRLSNAAYIAKVTLSNGQVISKKAIKRK